MPFTITESGGSSVPVPSGKYVATLQSIEEKDVQTAFSTSMRIWHFLADVAGELLPVEGTSSTNSGTRTKSYEWLTAILGTAPTVGSTVDDPVGRRCIVEVGQKDGYPRVIAVSTYSEPEQVLAGVPR